MHRRKVRLGGLLSGIAIAPNGKAEAAPPAPSAVLSFPPPLPDPAEVQAVRNLLAELGRVVENLRTRERAAIDKVAETAVELGVAVAERLVNAEIAADRQRLDRIVRAALERMQPARAITVRGHADDLTALQGQLEDSMDNLTLRPEKTCARGQLKIEADEWFAEFDTQRSLTELREQLLEETFAIE